MKRFLRSPRFQAVLAWMMGRYLRFALRTTRWRVADEAIFERLVRGESAVLSFWHETLPLIPAMLLEARRRGGYRPVPMYTMVSKHSDGQFIGRVVGGVGIYPVLGSSSRGGATAFRSLLGLMANGAIIGLTPDGPRGPARKAAPGVAMLPAMSGVPVIPCGVLMRPALRAGGWDRMVIPLPFARGVIALGEPIRVPRKGWEASIAVIEAATTQALERAERLCGT
ncbi:MAG: lysophospholipid acyltransferase family protein [Acetobacteraceae bacterium]